MSYRATAEWPYNLSCGGAVYRQASHGREYALLYRGERFGTAGNSWHLPKGTLEEGETLEACALREIREELGMVVTIGQYLGSTHGTWHLESSGFLIDATRHYFLCRSVSKAEEGMDMEHDSMSWYPADEAAILLQKQPKDEHLIIERAEAWLMLHDNI